MKEAERELEPFRQLRPTARRLRTIKLNLAAIRGLFDYLGGLAKDVPLSFPKEQ